MNDKNLRRCGLLLVGAGLGIVCWEFSKLGENRANESRPVTVVAAVDDPAAKAPSAKPSATESPQAVETPIGPRWWPSRWGKDDQRGAANMMSPQRVLDAVKLMRTGKIYQLGRVYERDMPTFPHRTFRLTIPAFRTVDGDNMRVGRDEFFVGEIGQMGTQMDGLGHVGARLADGDYYYNGFRSDVIEDAYGLKSLGVENVGVFFTRGVLVDVAGHERVKRLEVGYEISLAEFRATLEAQGTRILPGDVVLIRTGHGLLWKVDNDKYGSGEPGIGLDVANWLIAQKPMMVGSDNWGIEVDPSPTNPRRKIEVHQMMITRQGIYFLENIDLEELAADKAHEFGFVFAPLRLKGATGSPGNPIAVR